MREVPNDDFIRSSYLEYETLRAEILKRIEMRQQIVAITLTLAGVFLGFGLKTESVALVYPPLATFLAFGWSQNDYRIRALAKYIRNEIEKNVPGLNYETYTNHQRKSPFSMGSWRFVVLSHCGIIVVTQLLAIGIEISKFTFNTLEWVLVCVDFLAVLFVFWIMGKAIGGWFRKKSAYKDSCSSGTIEPIRIPL